MTEWNAADLSALLELQTQDGDSFACTTDHDVNLNGRIFGGQLLGQATAAALATINPDRQPTMLQAVFLNGALANEPLHYAVTRLQEGKRFSSRRVSATQGGRQVIDINLSSATLLAPYRESVEPRVPDMDSPDTLPTNEVLACALAERFTAAGYRYDIRPTVDFRFVDTRQLFSVDDPVRFQYWIRCAQPLGDAPALHAAAIAYLSDNWLSYPAAARRLTVKQPDESLYIASLNHSIWFHAPCRADEWLLVDSKGVDTGGGRGSASARVFTRDGRLVMSLMQECLILSRDT